MNQKKWLIGGLSVVALALIVYTFVGSNEADTSEADTDNSSVVETKRNKTKTGSLERDDSEKTSKAVTKPAGSKNGIDKQSGHSPSVPVAVTEETTRATAKKTAAEKAVEAWETLIDELVEMKDPPTKERMASVKEAFDKLDKSDQMDAIQRSLNLLPDDQFTSLFGILYDKNENPEVLDAIFSDALNRPEDIKVPMMKDFAVDKTHPMFFESARILDVTGELDEMAGQADDENEDGQEEEMAEDDDPAEQ